MVNLYIYLPKSARLGDVAKVAGVLAGMKASLNEPYPIKSHEKISHFVVVKGASVSSTSVPDMPEIILTGEMVDGLTTAYFYFRYQVDMFSDKFNMIIVRHTEFWEKVGRGLVNFFGGMVLNDVYKVIHIAPERHKNDPVGDGEDDYLWDAFQKRILELKPINLKDENEN